jgi:peptide/nickel transport system substrate-binding protein/oligopeptide transport system substrate-binding protein
MNTKKSLILIAISIVVFAAGTIFFLNRTDDRANSGENQVVFAMENEVATLNPVQISDIFAFRVSAQVFEGLLELDEAGTIQPCLAESWSSNPDFTTWRFKIRPGVKFHAVPVIGFESRAMNAADVAFSLQRSVAATSASSFALGGIIKGAVEFQAGNATEIPGIRVIDDQTLEIDLVRPEASFLHRLSNPYIAIFPKEAADAVGEGFGTRFVSGTGPYRVDAIAATEISLSRHPEYWRNVGTEAPEKLVFRVIKNDSIRLAEMRNGRLDGMRLVPSQIAANVIRDGEAISLRGNLGEDAMLTRVPTFSSYFVALNTERLSPALRRALSLGVNRTEALDVVGNGIGRIRVGTVPEGCGGYVAPFPGDIFDPAAAKAALAEAEAGTGTDRKIELLVHEMDSSEVLGELLQSQLTSIGIQLEVRKLDFNTAIARMIEGNFDALALSFQYVYSSPEPILRSGFHSSSIPAPNFWRLKSDEIDAMLDELSGKTPPEALAFAAAIEGRVVAEAPAIFLYELDNLFVTRGRALGRLQFTRHGVPLFWKMGLP